MIQIQKDRQSYLGFYKNQELHIDVDTVKFDHSPTTRYFIEAEVLSTDKVSIGGIKLLIIEFLKELLAKSMIVEATSMFNMAFNNL